MDVKFKKLSSESYELRYPYHEGGITLASNGKWAWWVRCNSGRGAGEAETLKSAKSSLLVRVHKLNSGH